MPCGFYLLAGERYDFTVRWDGSGNQPWDDAIDGLQKQQAIQKQPLHLGLSRLVLAAIEL